MTKKYCTKSYNKLHVYNCQLNFFFFSMSHFYSNALPWINITGIRYQWLKGNQNLIFQRMSFLMLFPLSLLEEFLALARWFPAKAGRVDSQYWTFVLCTLYMFFYKLRRDTDDVLALPILDHVERL